MRCDATAINLAVCIMQQSQCRQLTTTARATCTASQLGAKMWRGIYSKIVGNAEGCGEGKEGRCGVGSRVLALMVSDK